MCRSFKLYHYSAVPIKTVSSTQQDEHDWFKPIGLWVSAETGLGDSWPKFCRENSLREADLNCVHHVILRDDAKILRLCSEFDLQKFGMAFGDGTHRARGPRNIHWPEVAEIYHGIIIAPMVRMSCLRQPDWYDRWDCASGCIWDAAAIASIELEGVEYV